MNKGMLLFIVLIFLSSFVCGDGCVMTLTYDEYGVEKDVLLSGEDSQVSVIDYKNGIEDMLISVKVTPEGDGMLWIFPVPADPEKNEIDIDITSEFPEFEGYNVKNKLGGKIKELEGWSLISQIWSVFPAFITNPDLVKREFFHAQKRSESYEDYTHIALSSGSDLYLEEPDYGVRVYHSINKLGLTSELLTARHGEGLKKYLAEKNMTLPESVVDEIDWYIGGEYAFIVSWVSNPKEFGGREKDLALRVKFPTDRIYYPLKLTSVYGNQVIPMTIYFRGHVNPILYDFIKSGSETDYFISENYSIPPELDSFFGGSEADNLKYTRLKINTQSRNLKQDLWVRTFPPISIIFADFGLTLPYPLFELLLFAFFSCLASLLAGWVIFGREVKFPHLILLGLSNFTTFIGFSILSYKMFLRKAAGEKFQKENILFFTSLSLFLLSLILMKTHVSVGGILSLIFLSLMSLSVMIYFLLTLHLILFSFVSEEFETKNMFYLGTISLIILLLAFGLLIPWVFKGYTLLPEFTIFVLVIPFLFLFIPPVRKRSKQIRGFKLIAVFLLLLALIPPLLYLTSDIPYGSPYWGMFNLLMFGILSIIGLITIFHIAVYPIFTVYSTVYTLYSLWRVLKNKTHEFNRRIFYYGILVNTAVTALILAIFLIPLMEGTNYWNLFGILFLSTIVSIFFIGYLSSTSLWYFILIRKELTQNHRIFLFVTLFSILFILISFFSTEALLLEYPTL